MKIILFIFLFSLSLISSGCFTYYPTRESPDSLRVEKDRYSKILKFQLYDGETIDVSEYDVKYYDKYKTNVKVFVYNQSDTIIRSQNPDSVKIKSTEKIISSDQIKSIIVERKKNNIAGTVIMITGISFVAFFIIFSIALSSDGLNIKL
jgi:hypothetical protein